MREFLAHLVLVTFGAHTSVLASFPQFQPQPMVRASQRVVARFEATSGASPLTAASAVPEPPGVPKGVDLAAWLTEGPFGESAWQIRRRTAAARTVAGPAFLVTPSDLRQGRFTGDVRLSSDEGTAAGFVVGYRAPLEANGDDPLRYDHLLITWEPAEAGSEVRGEWTLARVRADRTRVVLARVSGNHNAYALDQPRHVVLDFTAERIRLEVAGDEVFDVPGPLPTGRFGFYTKGSGGSLFADVRLQDAQAPPAPPLPGNGEAPDPLVGLTLDTTQLWPPSGDTINVGLTIFSTDPSGQVPTAIARVFADEPDDQDPADGNLWPDAFLEWDGLWLRSERRSFNDGRVYLILVDVVGPTGSAHDCASVVVPKENTATWNDAVNAQAAAAVAHCEANGNAPAGYFLIGEEPFQIDPPNRAMRPKLECVVEHGPGQFDAVFGYQNDNAIPVTVPVGPANKFTQAPLDRGQPDRFAVGRSPLTQGAFLVPFSGSNLTWSVEGPDRIRRNVTASSNTVRCAFTPSTPVAVDDTASTSIDTPVVIPVLANDSDPQAQPLHVMRVVPTTGTVGINADGTVTFTPPTGFVGESSFTYVASDGAYGSDVANVTVSVSNAPINQPPTVDAGVDQAVTLPSAAALQGTASDDGLPAGGGLTVLWSKDGGPGTVSFAPADAVASSASFGEPGTYVLRLTASDSALTTSDTLTVVVSPPATPALSIADVAVTEGHEGLANATATVTLSPPSGTPVTVRYATADQTAVGDCDYLPRAGDLTFGPGETSATIVVPILGDVAIEADETLAIGLGTPVGATLADPSAVVTIVNDDTTNAPPSSPADRQPPNGALGIESDPTLSWTASDPDQDPLTFDVYLGTALDTSGQEWRLRCPATTGPSARYGAAYAYDDAGDRLILFGGQTAGGESSDVWVLENATGLGGTPAWTMLAPAAGPAARQRATAAYDGAGNRLIIYGGCTQGCTVAQSDAWVLTNANGSGGTPQWTALPDAPGARYGHAAAYDAASRRLIVFGGSSGASVHADAWLLAEATGAGTPSWDVLAVGPGPSAREGASAAYDALSNRLVVFGGRDASGAVSNEAWALSEANGLGAPPAWALLAVGGALPAARWGHASFYDADVRRLFVFGGTGAGLENGTNIAANDALVLVESGAALAWTRLEPATAQPPGRFLAAAAYSPGRARFVAVGGRDNRATPPLRDDVWSLSDPVGLLPLVSVGQTSLTYVAPTPDLGATYYWRVVARDGHGATHGSPVWRFSPNQPPTVSAGEDQTIVLGVPAELSAVVQDDFRPFGGYPSVTWTLASGPAPVTFTSASAAQTTAQFSQVGAYVLRATADDGAASASDELIVTVEPVPVAGRTWTTTADFDGGVRSDVETANDELKLAPVEEKFPFLWVAVSSKGTIVKIDTVSGAIVGEYHTSPQGQPKDPSRTTVDRNGNVWASNRAGNSVVRVGVWEFGQCVDRNGNGSIETSSGQDDIRPWPNTNGADTDGGVSTAADECILHYTRVTAAGTRHVSVNTANDVWVSGTGTNAGSFDLIDGATGQITRSEFSVGFGGYGGLIDANDVIWSAGPFLRWDTRLPLAGGNGGNWTGFPDSSFNSYGMCIDRQGNVWSTSHTGNAIRKFAPDGSLVGVFPHGNHLAQGCAVDERGDVWVAHSFLGPTTVGHIKNDGTFVGVVVVGNGPTGVAVDAAGKVWATNFNSRTVSRIDPDAGPIGADGVTRVGGVDFTTVDLGGNPYNYSDMTGAMLPGAPPQGTWTGRFDSQIPGATWGHIRWNASACGDGAVSVEAASEEGPPGPWVPVANGDVLPVPAGRFLNVRVTLHRSSTGESPILYDLSVGTLGFDVPGGAANAAPTVDAGPDRVVELPRDTDLAGTACDDARPATPLVSSWSQVSGPGEAVFETPDRPTTRVRFRSQGSADAGLDYSQGANPAGPWSYGWAATPGGAFVAGVPALYLGLPAWRRSATAPADFPVVSGNLSHVTLTFGGLALPPGFVHLHPANTGERAVVRWTAPSAGTYVFDGRFQGLSTLGPSSDVAIHSGGASLFNGALSAYAQQVPYSVTRTLAAGESVDFSVGYGANLNHTNDGTGLLLAVGREGSSTVAGAYVLRLTASDSALTAADDVSVTAVQPSCKPIPAGALSLWTGDGSGVDLISGQHATLGGNLVFGPGMVGQAYVFDGVDDQAVIQNPSQFSEGSFTLAAWVRSQDLSGRPLLDFSSATVFGPHLLQGFAANGTPLPGALFANIIDTAGANHGIATAAHALVPGHWHHVALTYDHGAGVAALYVDSRRAASSFLGVFTPRGGLPLGLGYRIGGGPRYFGRIDEALMVDRALSAVEIEAAYLAGSLGYCRPEPPLPDLTVTSLDLSAFHVNAQTLETSGTLSAGIANVGPGAAQGSFDVTFFEDRNGNGTLEAGTDAVLGSAEVSDVGAGQTVVASASVSGSVWFAGNAVHAYVDSAVEIDEEDEDNNYGSSLDCGAQACPPDLSPSFVRRVDGPTDISLTARIGNGGGSAVPAGVSVSYYDGPPGASGTLLQTTVTSVPIGAGGFADVAISVPPTTEAIPLWVVADDPPTVEESNEANNAYNSRVFLTDVPNAPPVVSAGGDQHLVYPQAATSLDGTVTDDGRPLNDLDTVWTKASGPGAVTFGDANAVDTTAAFGAPGAYVLRLTADDQELTASDDVTVVVEPQNQAPMVNAGPDLAVSTLSTAIDATVTDDGLPTGAPVGVVWSQVSGPAPVGFSSTSTVDVIVTFAAEGTYVLRLSASDTALGAFDEVGVVVTFANQPPVVSAGPDHVLTLPQDVATLTGTASDDGLPPPTSLTLAWSLVSGPGSVAFASPAAAQTSATFTNPGTYVVRFGATDGAENAFDDAVVTVQPAAPSGDPPSATLTSPSAGTRITGPVSVVGSALSESIASWQLEHRLEGDGPWARFASGTTQVTNGPLASLDTTLLMNGITEVRLTVTDTAGRSASATTHVVVKEQQKVGNFTVAFVDLEVPVAGLPIRVTRSYDSRDKRPGDFGYGWRLEVSDVRVEESDTAGLAWQATVSPGFFPTYCLVSANPPVVTLTLPDGRVLDFQMTLTPACQPFAPIDAVRVSYVPVGTTLGTLAPANGSDAYVFGSWPGQAELYDASDFSILDPSLYRYTSPDGRVFVVHDTQGLKSLKDLNGQTLTVSPTGITHSSGKGLAFTRDGSGRIATIVDPRGGTIEYGYDANGDLVSHTDRESNTTRFGYHIGFPHHLVSIEDPLGRRPIRNEYDGDGRLVRHIDAFGKTIEYTHQLGIRREIVTDRNLKQRVLDYDERGNVLQETDPLGKVVLRTYDARNNRLTETLPHDPGAPNPPTTTYTYDGSDNVLSVTDPENNRTEYTYNARRLVLTVKDPRGHFTTNGYDARGNLTSTRVSATLGGPALTETTYTNDAAGNPRTRTVVVDGFPQTTQYRYDLFGSLVEEIDVTGHSTTHVYDANGNRTRQTTTRLLPDFTEEVLETRYEYDANGRLLRTVDPDATSTRSVFDALGRQVEAYDKLGHRTSFAYDEMGRLERTTYADTTFEESTYDNEGRRLGFRDRRNKVTTYEYDDVGRLKKTTLPDANFTENTYDAAGRLTAVRDARGKTTTYEYDRVGRRTKVTVPITTGVSAETVFTYDANGNQLTVRDPLLRTTTFEYDPLNRRTKTIFPDTTYTETTYDPLGRRRTERDQAGRVTRFEYDGLGRLTNVTDAREKTTAYGYDEQGNRTVQVDANGRFTVFEYDLLGREVKRTLPAVGGTAAFETKAYDDAGNLESRTDFAGRVTTYGYDVMNRLVSRTGQCASPPCPGAADASFTYTDSGRRETVTDARGVTSYLYDDRDRLASLTYPDGRKLEYLYDGNGNRTTLTATIPAVGGGSPTVLTTSYTHDDANRLDLVTDTAGRVYDHGYDLNGNRTSLAQPNGTVTSYGYDPLNRLTSLGTAHGATTIQGYALTLGPAGNRERIDEADGTSRIYTYDELYRLTSDTVTISGLNQYTKGFTYDDVGNRQTQTTTIGPAGSPGPNLVAGTLAYAYDERDRLTTETLDANPPISYGWDPDGNLVTRSAEATYAWDRENRLVRVEKTDGSVVAHTYDADGVRVQTITIPAGGSAATTNFLVDTSGSLSHVVAETNGAGSLAVHYVRGDDLLSLMRPLVAAPSSPIDWQTRYYHADHIGSVRRLTNEAGQITDGYTYSAFGELIGHTGSDPQPYAFTGEPYDPNVGFQYHRARWMDPRVGRFGAADPFPANGLDPATLHRYVYAINSPPDRTDPTGLYAELAALNIALGLLSTIFSMAVPNTQSALDAVTGGVRFSVRRDTVVPPRAVVYYPATWLFYKDFALTIAGRDAGTRFFVVQWARGSLKYMGMPIGLIRPARDGSTVFDFPSWTIDGYQDSPTAEIGGLTRHPDSIDFEDKPGIAPGYGSGPLDRGSYEAALDFQLNVYDRARISGTAASAFHSPTSPRPLASFAWSFYATLSVR